MMVYISKSGFRRLTACSYYQTLDGRDKTSSSVKDAKS